MQSYPRFSGIWPALVTPFIDFAVDLDGLRKLVTRFAHAGVAGLAVCATTGEAGTLSFAERLTVLDTVLGCAPRLPVVMGVAGINPQVLHAELDAIRQRPVAGILVPPPYYVRPSQEAIVRFYADIAARAERPVIVYNIPYRTGVRIERATFDALARIHGIAAVKDCGGDVALTLALIADGRLDVLAGEDLQIFSTLCLGGAGAITASAHVRPDLFVGMAEAIEKGDLATARRVQYALQPTIEALFAEPSPAPAKAVLAALGLIRDEVRAPLLPATPPLRETLARLVRDLDGVTAAAAAR